MDDDGSLNLNNWGYYQQPMKGSLGLQLMPNLTPDHHHDHHHHRPLYPHAPYFPNHPPQYSHYHHHLHHHYTRDSDLPEPSYSNWIRQPRETPSNYSLIPTTQMIIHPLKEEEPPLIDPSQPLVEEDEIRKRHQVQAPIKPPKQKKSRKSESCTKSEKRKGTDVVINGVDLDLTRIPPPVCSCTGNPQQCYRWGVGGWQSACCTTSVSMYPLPMSQKRKGARIAGRKMSQGAFKKVLEKLAGEGYNLGNPIDLRGFWAKHGTNKFVTIR